MYQYLTLNLINLVKKRNLIFTEIIDLESIELPRQNLIKTVERA
jgi:hypothetical protein